MQICDILIECLHIKTIDLWFAFSHIVWFQPPPRRKLEIPGGWGVRGPGNSRREAGWTIKSLSGGKYHFVFDMSLNIASYRTGRSFLGHKKLEIYHSRLFLLILPRFPSFQKRFGCNFKGIRPTTTCFIACLYIRPKLLVTSVP